MHFVVNAIFSSNVYLLSFCTSAAEKGQLKPMADSLEDLKKLVLYCHVGH